MTRYVAVNMTTDEIISAGVADVIPGRAKVSRRKLTMNSLSVRTADQDWLQAAHPSEEQKKKLIGLILIIGTDLRQIDLFHVK